jgi:hypothetical protein
MPEIRKAREEWAYEEMRELLNAGESTWLEVSEEFYYQALEVLPPYYVPGGFMVSEPLRHVIENGKEAGVFAGFSTLGGKHYARYATLAAFPRMVVELRRTLNAAA